MGRIPIDEMTRLQNRHIIFYFLYQKSRENDPALAAPNAIWLLVNTQAFKVAYANNRLQANEIKICQLPPKINIGCILKKTVLLNAVSRDDGSTPMITKVLNI